MNTAYGDERVYHKAHLTDGKGGVSPLCAKRPRILHLGEELWTNRWEAITCPKCLALKERQR